MTKIKNIDIPSQKRMLFVSDIHGNLQGFKNSLQKVKYTSDDVLFIMGDIIEKGNENLKLLDFLMEMEKENESVYIISGNCDAVFQKIVDGIPSDLFLYYALKRKNSIINEMASEMNVVITPKTDTNLLCQEFKVRFKKYYDFLNSLNHIIIVNNQLVLVHGGIDNLDNIPSDPMKVMKNDSFYSKSLPQQKIIIVGHFPTRNYCPAISNFNPIIDMNKKIISIDGGNNIVLGGQINVLILNDIDKLDFTFESYDDFEQVILHKTDKREKKYPNANIIYGNNEVEVIEKIGDFYLCQCSKSREYVYAHKSHIFSSQDRLYCYDGTSFFFDIEKDTPAKLVLKATPFSMVKINGVFGLIETKFVEEVV